MKKFMLVLVAIGLFSSIAAAQITQKLPEPNKTGGMPLMEAMAKRKSAREFAKKDIDEQTLSEILWSAYGVSHSDDLRTIPTGQNKKDIEVYAVKADGVWHYDAIKNVLHQISDKNHLPDFQSQDYMKDAPLVLVYTSTVGGDYGGMHAGSAYQNVGLYAASKSLNNVVRGYFDKKVVNKMLNLPKNKTAVVSQAIGWKK
jgi:nitroreductase